MRSIRGSNYGVESSTPKARQEGAFRARLKPLRNCRIAQIPSQGFEVPLGALIGDATGDGAAIGGATGADAVGWDATGAVATSTLTP